MAAKAADYQIPRLCAAIEHSRRVLERFRTNRRDMVRQYVGRHWSEDGNQHAVPVNLIDLYVEVVARNLVAKSPRVMLSTFRWEHKPAVRAMQDWANAEIERMGLANTLQRAVIDALFSIGIVKVALATPADAANVGWGLAAGTPYAEVVDLDDFAFDVHATDFRECSFMAHRFRVPLSVAQEMDYYAKKGRKKLQASEDDRYNEQGDERIKTLGRGWQGGDDDEYEDMVDLWEVYLPRHRVVLTLSGDDIHAGGEGDYEPLRVQRWLGPDSGPYHVLGYGVVPGNAMPKAPIQNLYDLHLATNELYRKLFRQAGRQKQLLAVDGAAIEDATRAITANDGEAFQCNRPEGMKPMDFGGPNAMNFQFADHLAQKFSYQAGNLDGMGGLSPQSKTLGQDRMLAETSSKAIADKQATTVDFVTRVCTALLWFHHNDPMRVYQHEHKVDGYEKPKLREVFPAGAKDAMGDDRILRRDARFEELGVRVDPYSMQHATPSSRLQFLVQTVTQIIAPMLPMLQQQGIALDLNTLLKKIGEFADQPDLAEVLTIQEPPQDPSGGGAPDGPPKPAVSQRTYTRENVPMRTQQGDSLNLRNAMMGVNTGEAARKAQAGVPA